MYSLQTVLLPSQSICREKVTDPNPDLSELTNRLSCIGVNMFVYFMCALCFVCGKLVVHIF
jgi:hypothetical protein